MAFRGEPLFRAEWTHRVVPGESVWSLEDGQRLLFSVEKAGTGLDAKRSWWASAFKGEPEIDLSKVDSTKKLSDYDRGTQAEIRKVMYDRAAATGGGLAG